MTRFLLIRHGAHDLLGRVLAGRADGVSLNVQGRKEAEELPRRLAGCRVDAIFTSPMQRAVETAAPIAVDLNLSPTCDPAFHEIDFGAWTSLTFGELQPLPEWQKWNNCRSKAQPPGGETMKAVQSRFIKGLAALAGSHREQTVAIFSHGDPIKAALMDILGMPLDLIARLEISPASISIIHWDATHPIVTLLNDQGSFTLS